MNSQIKDFEEFERKKVQVGSGEGGEKEKEK